MWIKICNIPNHTKNMYTQKFLLWQLKYWMKIIAKNPKKSYQMPGSHITDDEIRSAEEKFAESLHLAQMGMYNLLENDVSIEKNWFCVFLF